MNVKRFLALCVTLAMIFGVSACGGTEKESGLDAGIQTNPFEGVDGEVDAPVDGHDFQKAYAALAPETVVAVIDGKSVLWQEFFYWIYNAVQTFEQNYGEITDWNAVLYSDTVGDVTYAAYILENAMRTVEQYAAINHFAAQTGTALTEEDRAVLASERQAAADSIGGDEAFLQYLSENFCTETYYEYLSETARLSDRCFQTAYGENGEKLGEDEILEYVAGDGYLMAKHILFKTTDDANAPLQDDVIQAKRQSAEEALAELNAAPADARAQLFDEIMNGQSDDGGLAMFPDGYLFQSGDMVPEFEAATEALREGEISGLVETAHGFHIIMRLPIDVETTPMRYSNYLYYGYAYPLRYIAASSMQGLVLSGVVESMGSETTDILNTLELSQIF